MTSDEATTAREEEQQFLDAVRHSGDSIITNLEHIHIPDTFVLAVAAYMTTTLIDRMEPAARTEIAASLIARLTTAQRFDA